MPLSFSLVRDVVSIDGSVSSAVISGSHAVVSPVPPTERAPPSPPQVTGEPVTLALAGTAMDVYIDATPQSILFQALGGDTASGGVASALEATAAVGSGFGTSTTTDTSTSTSTSTSSMCTDPRGTLENDNTGQFPYVLESTGRWGSLTRDADNDADADDDASNCDDVDDDNVFDAEKEAFLLEQITAYETIEQLEDEISRERREVEAITATLVDQVAVRSTSFPFLLYIYIYIYFVSVRSL